MPYLFKHICDNVNMGVIQTREFCFFKIFRHFYISSSCAPRGISQYVFAVYYVQRSLGYNINVGAKLYILGRAKVFSSVATDFWCSTIGNHVKYVDEMCWVEKVKRAHVCVPYIFWIFTAHRIKQPVRLNTYNCCKNSRWLCA